MIGGDFNIPEESFPELPETDSDAFRCDLETLLDEEQHGLIPENVKKFRDFLEKNYFSTFVLELFLPFQVLLKIIFLKILLKLICPGLFLMLLT